jgi:hypothetical protein
MELNIFYTNDAFVFLDLLNLFGKNVSSPFNFADNIEACRCDIELLRALAVYVQY